MAPPNKEGVGALSDIYSYSTLASPNVLASQSARQYKSKVNVQIYNRPVVFTTDRYTPNLSPLVNTQQLSLQLYKSKVNVKLYIGL